jgi:predicted ATPase/DNA-binding SARP family transcriptional activator
VRIGLLGTLLVHDDAGQPVRVGGHRVRSLLILLAMDAGHTVPAWSLAGRLWPDDPPADANNALQTLISRLRGALREVAVIESEPAGYRLAVQPSAVDVFEFEDLARQGRAALTAADHRLAASVLRRALALWRGPALADVAAAEFAAGLATRLEELRLSALLDRIEADLELGEPAGLVGELRSLVSASPLAERPRILLIRALQAENRQADALAVYTQARELLAEQLGVDPSPSLEEAYLAVLRQQGAPVRQQRPGPSPRPAARRKPLASFVGRETDMDGLHTQLARHRLVTLTGPGGIGKTRLAAEVADESGARDVHMVELARLTSGSDVPFAVLDAVAGQERSLALRAPEDTRTDPLDRMATALQDREALVILDNCEHVVDAAAMVADRILTDCERVRILATSREPLRITGETLWPLAPLPEDAAVRLLADRAAAVVPGFRVDAGNEEIIRHLCQALDGMPLAIELAAAWLRVLSPAQLGERLGDRFALLTSGSRSALPRHQTLRAVVDWSWDSLSKPERILARRLSVFPGGVSLDAAEGVCADGSLPASEILPTLSGLVDKSILMSGEGTDGTGSRYRMLETIRAYGAERLTQAGEDTALRAAFTGYFLRLAETADPLLRGPSQHRWYRTLEDERANLYAAIRMSIAAADSESALRLTRALGWFWMTRSDGQAAELLASTVLTMPADDSGQILAEARVICALMVAGQSWDIDPVRAQMTAAVENLTARFGYDAGMHPLAAFGAPMLALQDRDPERALAIFREWDDDENATPWDHAVLTLMRSQVSMMIGRQDDSERLITEAVGLFRAVGDDWGLSATLSASADSALLRGDHRAAFAALAEAVELCTRLGTAVDRGHFEGKLAQWAIRLGDLEAAREHLRLSLELSAHHTDTKPWRDFIRAELTWAEGDFAETIAVCQTALDELASKKSIWWHSFRATVLARLALAKLRTGDHGCVRELLADALRSGTEWLERPQLAAVLDSIAVFTLDDDPGLAATLLGAGHTMRGRFDESSLDSPAVRDAAKSRLGPGAFDQAYERGRALGYDDAVALAGSVTGAVGVTPRGLPLPGGRGPYGLRCRLASGGLT